MSLSGYGVFQIDNHHDRRLNGSSEQRNEANPNSDRKVVLQQPKQVDSAGQSERNREQHVRGFQRRVISDVKQTEDNDEYDWHNYQQTTSCSLLVFVLAAPLDVVTGGQLRLARDRILRFINEATHVTSPNIEQHRPAEEAILAGNHRRALDFRDFSKLRQWDRRA